uniref:Uncharacterized protein n=1 Tax=viral metagenome TaxID=1070528 RepID=A0A6H1Z6U3_9ZZZZ
MGMYLDLHDVAYDHPEALKELNELITERDKYREALENLVNALKSVHDDPEYGAVWMMYQNHVPTGYRGRKYTKEFDDAQDALKGGEQCGIDL